MIILEDSVWNKLKRFADNRRNKVLAKRDAKLDSTDYEDSSIGIKTQKLYKALADKSNLSLTKDIWITALLEIRDPLQSELYDFLMNSQSEFIPQVATVITKLFKNYGKLTAEVAIDTLNLDNPEYTENKDRVAELIKETKDYIEKSKKSISIKQLDQLIKVYSKLTGKTEEVAKNELDNLESEEMVEKVQNVIYDTAHDALKNSNEDITRTQIESVDDIKIPKISPEILDAKTEKDINELLTRRVLGGSKR